MPQGVLLRNNPVLPLVLKIWGIFKSLKLLPLPYTPLIPLTLNVWVYIYIKSIGGNTYTHGRVANRLRGTGSKGENPLRPFKHWGSRHP